MGPAQARERRPARQAARRIAVRADLGEKGMYYRIQAGPLADGRGRAVCGELKRRNLGCIIAR